MPRGDGTGPAGMGPMTGRAAGYCAGYSAPGFTNGAVRGGFGGYGGRGGRGGGRGRRNWYYATGVPGWARAAQGMPAYGSGYAPPAGAYAPPAAGAQYAPPAQGAAPAGSYYAPSPEDEMAMLSQQAEMLSQQLEQINQRIAELE